MPQETLRNHPLYRAEDLGKPIPPAKHAISMCLPRWQDVIGYEENNPATMEQLQVGYPRFFYHPLVTEAFETIGKSTLCQIYTTRAAAERCAAYLTRKNPGAAIELKAVKKRSATLIRYPAASADDAKDYWQHAGEGISSRYAESLLERIPAPDATEAQDKIISRIAEFSGAAKEDIYLFPSGMAAIYAAFLMVQELNPSRPSVQFAFPYGDTLKLQNKLGTQQALFYSRGDAADLQALENELGTNTINSLFCEFPTNPLLTCVDLPKLRELADAHDFPIIIDETLGACTNQNTLPLSDITAISLTKFFSGTSDVMGGALILNSKSVFAERFSELLKSLHEPEAFYPTDLIQMERDSADYRERVSQINQTALEVCDFLHKHPAVKQVFYPAFTDKDMYDQFKLPDGGYGGLFSFVLHRAEQVTEPFYDSLEITKGPNLGTSFSLCCPFTLIAHYNELEWAESAGASRYLIRISIGLEPAKELIARLERALKICR